jgi:hypothetical protein
VHTQPPLTESSLQLTEVPEGGGGEGVEGSARYRGALWNCPVRKERFRDYIT